MKTKYEAQIAEIILQQLGGKRFLVMTGAKRLFTLSGYKNICGGLTIELPKGFYVAITLTSEDLYNIECYKIRGIEKINLKKVEGVFCDMLRDVFTQLTGLDTVIPNVIFEEELIGKVESTEDRGAINAPNQKESTFKKSNNNN